MPFVFFGFAFLRSVQEPFNTVTWKATASDRPTTGARNRQERDVLRRVLKPGMPEASVISLLGPPDSRLAGNDLLEYADMWGGGDIRKGDTLVGYIIVDDPPFPQSYTDYLRILLRQGTLVRAWDSPEL